MASFSFASAITLSILCLSSISFIEAQKDGFSLELIHRDSPKSPFYNPLETPSQRLAKALRRSINRANRFSRALGFNHTFVSPNVAQGDIVADSGSYLLRFSIGTPPVSTVAIADTGSDLIWIQCEPCTECFQQDDPIFNPESSKTYKDVSCTSSECQSLNGNACSENTCQYEVRYGDNSYSNGNVAVETLTLDSTTGKSVALPKTVFGCGHQNGGTFSEKTTGIVGLGGGEVSLISQMNSSIDGKFSYCLLPHSSSADSSKLNFGSNAVVSGSGTVSTPIVGLSPDTFYYLTLEAISVGNKKIVNGDSSSGVTKGNIIIDSGTTLTLLKSDFYSKVKSAVSAAIDATPISDPNQILNLCYNAESNLTVPVITMHFTGADVKLKPVNTFVLVSEGTVCLAFAGSDNLSIYGNLSQMDFLVGYDTVKRTVSFKPTDCSNH